MSTDIEFFLIGADHRTRWAFGAPGSPVRLAEIPTGLQGAGFEHDYQEIVGMDGALYRGSTDKQAEIGLKVWVVDRRSSAWARRQHALWRESLGRGRNTCRLYVVSKESGYWWLDCRADNVSEADYMGEHCKPGAVGETGEIVKLVSDRSFWERFDEERTYTRDTCRTASLANLGDQPAYLRWTVTGGHDGVDLGVGDDVIHLPGQKVHDAGYVIDTDPLWPSITDITGKNLQADMPDAYWSAPLPARGDYRGNAQPLTIKPTNPTENFRVEVAYTPRTEQAW